MLSSLSKLINSSLTPIRPPAFPPAAVAPPSSVAQTAASSESGIAAALVDGTGADEEAARRTLKRASPFDDEEQDLASFLLPLSDRKESPAPEPASAPSPPKKQRIAFALDLSSPPSASSSASGVQKDLDVNFHLHSDSSGAIHARIRSNRSLRRSSGSPRSRPMVVDPSHPPPMGASASGSTPGNYDFHFSTPQTNFTIKIVTGDGGDMMISGGDIGADMVRDMEYLDELDRSDLSKTRMVPTVSFTYNEGGEAVPILTIPSPASGQDREKDDSRYHSLPPITTLSLPPPPPNPKAGSTPVIETRFPRLYAHAQHPPQVQLEGELDYPPPYDSHRHLAVSTAHQHSYADRSPPLDMSRSAYSSRSINSDGAIDLGRVTTVGRSSITDSPENVYSQGPSGRSPGAGPPPVNEEKSGAADTAAEEKVENPNPSAPSSLSASSKTRIDKTTSRPVSSSSKVYKSSNRSNRSGPTSSPMFKAASERQPTSFPKPLPGFAAHRSRQKKSKSPPSTLKPVSGSHSSSGSHRVARNPVSREASRPDLSYEQHASKFFGRAEAASERESVVSPIPPSEEEVDELEGNISPIWPSGSARSRDDDGEAVVQEEEEVEVEEQAAGNVSEILGVDGPDTPWLRLERCTYMISNLPLTFLKSLHVRFSSTYYPPSSPDRSFLSFSTSSGSSTCYSGSKHVISPSPMPTSSEGSSGLPISESSMPSTTFFTTQSSSKSSNSSFNFAKPINNSLPLTPTNAVTPVEQSSPNAEGSEETFYKPASPSNPPPISQSEFVDALLHLLEQRVCAGESLRKEEARITGMFHQCYPPRAVPRRTSDRTSDWAAEQSALSPYSLLPEDHAKDPVVATREEGGRVSEQDTKYNYVYGPSPARRERKDSARFLALSAHRQNSTLFTRCLGDF